MKYIKQYEAFDATILTNILSFLKDKATNGIDKFKKDFKSVAEAGDFKMDKLKMSDIKYLKYQEALDLIGDDDKLRYIKFWFSSEEGYITYTGTSNIKMNPIDGNLIPRSKLDELSKKFKIKGLLKKVDSSELNTGDYIVLRLGDRYDSSDDDITVARVFVEGTVIYAIQDVRSGSTPNRNFDDWRQYGHYGWSIASNGNYASDHSKLYKIEVSDDYDSLKYEDLNPIDNDNFNWNLPLDPNLKQIEWNTENYISGEGDGYYDDDDNWVEYNKNEPYPLYEIRDKANFAIVIDLKDVNIGELNKIKDFRKDSKKDAISFLSDDEFKKINVERYFNEIFKKFGLQVGVLEIGSLNRLINIILCRDLFFVASNFNRRSYYFNQLISILNSIVRNNGARQSDIDQIKNLYSQSNTDYLDMSNKGKTYKGDSKIIYDKYVEFGKRLSQIVMSLDMSDIDDLNALNTLIRTLDSYQSGNYFSNIENPRGVDLERLNKFEKAVKIILR